MYTKIRGTTTILRSLSRPWLPRWWMTSGWKSWTNLRSKGWKILIQNFWTNLIQVTNIQYLISGYSRDCLQQDGSNTPEHWSDLWREEYRRRASWCTMGVRVMGWALNTPKRWPRWKDPKKLQEAVDKLYTYDAKYQSTVAEMAIWSKTMRLLVTFSGG